MKKKAILVLLLFLSTVSVAFSQQKTIENFKLTNAANKHEVSLTDFNSKKAIAVIFTSNYCPYSKLYEERILKLHRQYTGQGLQIILINPNDPVKSSNDSIEKMAEKAAEKQYPFPYLADKNQAVCNQFGATKTPEVFLLVKKGGTYQVVYGGAIDDNPQVPQDVATSYLDSAIASALGGKAIANKYARPTGCIIKKN